jgi:hypothetical protein
VITRLHKTAAEHDDALTLTLTSETVGVDRRPPLDSA